MKDMFEIGFGFGIILIMIAFPFYIWNRQSERNEARNSLLKAAYMILFRQFYLFLRDNPMSHKGIRYEDKELDTIARIGINQLASINIFGYDQNINDRLIEIKKIKWLASYPNFAELLECIHKNQGGWLKYFLKSSLTKDNEDLQKLFKLVSHEYLKIQGDPKKSIAEYSNVESWIDEGIPAVRSDGIIPPFVVFAVILLLIGPSNFDLHHGYFEFMRLVVCGFSGYVAYTLFNRNSSALPWLFLLIAILFNPFVEIHLQRTEWNVIDLIVASLLLLWVA